MSDLKAFRFLYRYDETGGGGCLSKYVKAADMEEAVSSFWVTPWSHEANGIKFVNKIEIVSVEEVPPEWIRHAILYECDKHPGVEITPGSFVALLWDYYPENLVLEQIRWLEDDGQLAWYHVGGVRHYWRPQYNSTKPGEGDGTVGES